MTIEESRINLGTLGDIRGYLGKLVDFVIYTSRTVRVMGELGNISGK